MISLAKKALVSAVTATVAVVALAAPAPAVQTSNTQIAIPTGVWDIRVTRPGASYPGVFHFSPLLGACSGDGAYGLWWPTGRDTFSYKMVGRLNNPDGSQFGWIDINQNATLTGGSYAGSGIHHVYDTSWTLVATVEVTITGVLSEKIAPC